MPAIFSKKALSRARAFHGDTKLVSNRTSTPLKNFLGRDMRSQRPAIAPPPIYVTTSDELSTDEDVFYNKTIVKFAVIPYVVYVESLKSKLTKEEKASLWYSQERIRQWKLREKLRRAAGETSPCHGGELSDDELPVVEEMPLQVDSLLDEKLVVEEEPLVHEKPSILTPTQPTEVFAAAETPLVTKKPSIPTTPTPAEELSFQEKPVEGPPYPANVSVSLHAVFSYIWCLITR